MPGVHKSLKILSPYFLTGAQESIPRNQFLPALAQLCTTSTLCPPLFVTPNCPCTLLLCSKEDLCNRPLRCVVFLSVYASLYTVCTVQAFMRVALNYNIIIYTNRHNTFLPMSKTRIQKNRMSLLFFYERDGSPTPFLYFLTYFCIFSTVFSPSWIYQQSFP